MDDQTESCVVREEKMCEVEGEGRRDTGSNKQVAKCKLKKKKETTFCAAF